MKEHMERVQNRQHIREQLMSEEKSRHEHALKHEQGHLEQHHKRPYNSQHGHDLYKYEGD